MIYLDIVQRTVLYSNIGAPISLISGIVHLRSNALERTILKIFCTLIECEVEQKINGAFIARAKRRACFVTSSCSSFEKLAN